MHKLGILGCSEIAFNRFMPAAIKVDGLRVVCVAEEYDARKLKPFCEKFDLEVECDFESILAREDIDCVYIPQPPALHYKWAMRALQCGKHVLVEKPSTTRLADTKSLLEAAAARGLVLHENYMFQYHAQIGAIRNLIESGEIGEVRMYRLSFGFPKRNDNDFRYNKTLGGGALLDAGGYTLRLASILLGDSVHVDAACMCSLEGYEVDMFGGAMLSNDDGLIAQIGFGMDCAYQCRLEVWGSRATLVADRVFTAPEEFAPVLHIYSNNGIDERQLKADSHFQHSIESFLEEITNNAAREKMYRQIKMQASLVEEVRNKAYEHNL